MKKIMFNDKYGLTSAVLKGRKTMTRRLVKSDNIVSITTSDGAVHHVDKTFGSYREYMDNDGKVWLAWSPYKVGEVVAVAQSYETLANSGYLNRMMETSSTFKKEYCGAGWNNKMFVRADLMPHQIQITDIKVERLQDISEEDCLKEGVYYDEDVDGYKVANLSLPNKGFRGDLFRQKYFFTPRSAFAALIDKVSGKGTWERNPWVFAYSFELIK